MTREYRIIPAGACWETQELSSSKVVLRGPTKRDLIYRTIELARKDNGCKIVIHNHDGYIEEEKVFENDPEKKLKDFLDLYYSNLEPAYRYKEAVL